MFTKSKTQTAIKSQSSSCLWKELSETDQEVIKGGPGGFGSLWLKNGSSGNGFNGGTTCDSLKV